MTTLTLRDLDETVTERLRVRAAEHGRSIEAEAAHILRSALEDFKRPPKHDLYERIHARFAAIGGVDLALPPRKPVREPPRFD